MAYRQTVEQHHVLTFSQNIKMRAQTMTNPLMGAVMVEPCSGEAQDIADLIGSVDYQEGEDYGQRNPEIIPERTRRWLVRPADIESGQTITKQEKFDQAMDPTSPLAHRPHQGRNARSVRPHSGGAQDRGCFQNLWRWHSG
jgi:hypothetical protein